MRVRIRKSIAAFDFDYQVDQIAELEDTLARAWCASGLAVPEPDAGEIEAATVAPSETAMQPRARSRRR